MASLIIYMSKHGTTQNAAEKLKSKLTDSTIELHDLRKYKNPKLDDFDTVIIGGSIHAGMLQKRVKKLCETHQQKLLSKKLGLFMCCMEEGDTAQKQFDENFPEILRKHAQAVGFFGGEFKMEKMNWLEKTIVKKISGSSESISKLSVDAINDFAEKFNLAAR